MLGRVVTLGVARIAAIGNANCPGIKQAVHKTPLRQIGQSNDARALAIEAKTVRLAFGHEFQSAR